MATLSGWFHFRLKILRFDFLQHAFGSDLFRVIGDVQQVLIPNIFHQGDTGKPYQGLFDPIGSIASEEVQPFAHLVDVERDLRTGRGVVRRLSTSGNHKRHQAEHRDDPCVFCHSEGPSSLDLNWR